MNRTLRVWLKLLLRQVFAVQSFCKRCGRTVHDFIVPDIIWDEIATRTRWGHVLCYDCFCEICGEIGLPTVWKLDAAEVLIREKDQVETLQEWAK